MRPADKEVQPNFDVVVVKALRTSSRLQDVWEISSQPECVRDRYQEEAPISALPPSQYCRTIG